MQPRARQQIVNTVRGAVETGCWEHCRFVHATSLSHPFHTPVCVTGRWEERAREMAFGEKVKVKLLSCVRLFATPWTVAYQASQSMEFPGKSTGVDCGNPFPSPGDLPNPGIERGSPARQADALPSEPPGKPRRTKFRILPLAPMKLGELNLSFISFIC